MATVFNKAFNGVGVVCKATVRNNGNCYCTKLPKVVNDVIVNNLEYYNTYAPALLTMVIVNNAVAFSHQPLLSTIAVIVLKKGLCAKHRVKKETQANYKKKAHNEPFKV